MPALTVAEIARVCESIAEGDPGRIIRGANALESAGPSDLSFVSNAKGQTAAEKSCAGCLIAGDWLSATGNWSVIRVRDPRSAFARVLGLLYPARHATPSIHPSAVIAETVRLASGCFVGPNVVIEDDAHIGRNCYLGPGTHIGARVVIGEGTVIHSHVTLYDGVQIGARVILHAGCVIGADGFGFTFKDGRYEKFPQVGTVKIENDVEIGANCCIDRAALGITRVGTGTKLDNLVHIAHNCDVGEHVVIAAQTGFAGGVIVGDYAVIGGQVGAGEKAKIASKAIVGSKGGILSFQKVPAGEPVWGIPARPVRQHLKGLANVGKIPELKEEIRKLKRRVEASNNEQQ
ncbi:MAG: UDP-3-O-(3-hydroxymyristoyl)glucosamine N-acyltransferase [Acidobacteriaceae bacterium]|nr:UDP-3-O-(3-hydroxymyristoyl)glucosamine N-acyltransferase [Acidobacteriaceae bacterium]